MTHASVSKDVSQDGLAAFRAELDTLDHQLIALLGRRLEIAREVARYKSANDIPVMQHGRVKNVKERNSRLGEAVNLDPAFVERLYGVIIDEMCRVEDEIVDGG